MSGFFCNFCAFRFCFENHISFLQSCAFGFAVIKEECLVRIAEKYPFFNLLLGEVYAVRYRDNNDFSYIRKAIECYYKADGYGMLIPKYANILLGMYDYWGQKGMLGYDEQEIERLKVLAKRTY